MRLVQALINLPSAGQTSSMVALELAAVGAFPVGVLQAYVDRLRAEQVPPENSR